LEYEIVEENLKFSVKEKNSKYAIDLKTGYLSLPLIQLNSLVHYQLIKNTMFFDFSCPSLRPRWEQITKKLRERSVRKNLQVK